jgi:hypothetical protein
LTLILVGVAVSLTMILADALGFFGLGCLSLVLFSQGMWLLLIVAAWLFGLGG